MPKFDCEKLNNLKINRIKKKLKTKLEKQPQILFAYLHGSILSADSPRDIDLAVYLYADDFNQLSRRGEISLSFAIPLEMDLEKLLIQKVDLQVLNRAPLSFRYRVITEGILIVDKNSNLRSDFEYLSRVEYFDFRPRRNEYLREIMQ
jgi:predicted nucleotidyltransferase